VAQPCEITGFDREIRTATPDLARINDEFCDRWAMGRRRSKKLKGGAGYLNAERCSL